MAIYGLFVGVNRYEAPPNKISPLYGCVNDVELISATLISRFAIPDENCLPLIDALATKKNVIGSYYICNPRDKHTVTMSSRYYTPINSSIIDHIHDRITDFIW